MNVREIRDLIAEIEGLRSVKFEPKSDKGTFQITVHNVYNGYYGHNVRVVSEQVSLDQDL